jgi:predicted RNA-binding Zn-ribbon protein involved in translation (DUF1610 family)
MSTRQDWLDWRGRVLGVLRLAQDVIDIGGVDTQPSIDCKAAMAELIQLAPSTEEEPVAMRLKCPACGELHIDEGEFATKPHHTHACQHCGHTWRPAIVPTTGVRFLPGFKNEEPPIDWKSVLPHQIRVACAECGSDTNAPGTFRYVFRDGAWHCGRHAAPEAP